MRPGFFRRLAAFFIDSMPILMVLSLLLTLFVGDLIKEQHPNFDNEQAIYEVNRADYNEAYQDYEDQLANEEITTQQFDDLTLALGDQFSLENEDFSKMWLSYYFQIIIYFYASYTLIYYFYVLLRKGQTYGRIMMKIELYGKINWFTLLLREFLWKTVFWAFTFSAGIAIDIGMIAFTRKKKTIRDYLSNTELRFTGPNYPF